MLDNLIERLPEEAYVSIRRFEYWLLAPKKICQFCVDCEQYEEPGPEGTCWYCEFRQIDTDWQGTCRAFKKGKRVDERTGGDDGPEDH